MKIKIDSRIQILIENSVKANTRAVFVVVGDRGRDRVADFHLLLSKARLTRPSVLWCYKEKLGFSSHKQKRIRQIKKAQQRGTWNSDIDDPFELFISSTHIRYTYYKDSHKILGNTFGMCVLQDFEALTPNLLCRTVETVEGGGLVVILLKTMTSLKQLYTLAMDIHQRYRTPSHDFIQPRFNERFLISLSACSHCQVLDDEFNVLNITDHPVEAIEAQPEDPELVQLKESMQDAEPVGNLLRIAKTMDQGKVIMNVVSTLMDKVKTVVGVTAARGRGKSAALGLAVAAAVYYNYSNIVVTAPSPENLNAFFAFLFKGLNALGYQEHVDYEVVRGAKHLKKNVLKVTISRTHRQVVEYITVNTTTIHADLIVIDEAAAIPLPFVKRLLGPYPALLSSTVHGYEGTGRALSLKLFESLTDLKQLKMSDPIRYARQDAVEKWLNDLLCLEATIPYTLRGSPAHPSECTLYAVNRDTLFSYNRASELFLHRLMSLFVSSHYKNSPNDLQMLSDAPSHMLFVLLPPINPGAESLPDILCAVQVSFEGKINQERTRKQLAKGFGGTGDLIPWTVSEYFQEISFCQLTGARVVRIATHPDVQGMGYGARALDELTQFLTNRVGTESLETALPNEGEEVKPRKLVKPLLGKLEETAAPEVDYLGVAFGLSEQLFNFWNRAGFTAVYIKQKPSDVTGEYSAIMLKSLTAENDFAEYFRDFQRRFKTLLTFDFRVLSSSLAVKILKHTQGADCSVSAVKRYISLYDLKRLEAFTKRLIDYRVILDLLPGLTDLFFSGKLGLELSMLQQRILVATTLQRKEFNDLPRELDLPSSQVVLLFNKIIKLLTTNVKAIYEKDISADLPHKRSLSNADEELEKRPKIND